MRALLDRPGTGRPSRGLSGRVTAAILITTLLTGCHAQQRIDIPGGAPPRPHAAAVQPGDHVKVTLQSGTIVYLTVAEVRPEELVGTTGQRLAYQSMSKLERRQVAPGRTVLLVVGSLALIVFAVTAAALASFAGQL